MVQQWIINSSRSHKASVRSSHDPSMMINQTAITNASASHKMSLNTPTHKAQKASCSHARSHVWKLKQPCAWTVTETIQGYIINYEWSKKPQPPTHRVQEIYKDLHCWKNDICRIKPVFLQQFNSCSHRNLPGVAEPSFPTLLTVTEHISSLEPDWAITPSFLTNSGQERCIQFSLW